MFRRGTRIALYLGPDRFDLQFATKELAQDMQTLGKLSMQLESRTIETWSVNQQVVSLSSAESEFYAIGSGCARGLTVKHVVQETLHTVLADSDVKMTSRTDSDAARGMIHRVGCGRVRHLQTRYLWHQQALREGQFNVVRCGTK